MMNEPFKGMDEVRPMLSQLEAIFEAAKRLSSEQVTEIFRRIASGEDKHGDFLTHFAEAICHADPANFGLLRPTALALIVKYQLDKEVQHFAA